MKFVIQRVKNAGVVVDGARVGECGEGLMILLGVAKGDSKADSTALAEKICKLRIFTDDADKMNLSVKSIDLIQWTWVTGQPKPSANADAVRVGNYSAKTVKVSADQICDLSANTRKSEKLLHIIGKDAAVFLAEHF